MHLSRLLIFVCLLSWTSFSQSVTENDKKIAEIIMDFACRLYKELFTPAKKNTIIAPFSIASSLILTFFGTGGDNANHLRNALHLSFLSETDILQTILAMMNVTVNNNASITQHMLNELFINKMYSTQYLQNNYINVVESVNLNDSSKAVFEINERVSTKTQNKIVNIVSELSAPAVAILAIGMFFKGEWALSFPEAATKLESFYIGSGSIITVYMMFQTGKFKYGESETFRCKAIELPYAESGFSMFILLPNDVNGLKELEAQLTADNLNALISRMAITKLEIVKIPKFKLEDQYNLTEVLRNFDLQNLFYNNDKSSSDSGEFKLSDMFLKTIVEISESGKESPGTSPINNNVTDSDSIQNRSKDFIANHPFIVLIKDDRTGVILCIGRILHPSID